MSRAAGGPGSLALCDVSPRRHRGRGHARHTRALAAADPRAAPSHLANLLDQGFFALRHVVVWLNEIQELLTQPRAGSSSWTGCWTFPVGPRY